MVKKAHLHRCLRCSLHFSVEGTTLSFAQAWRAAEKRSSALLASPKSPYNVLIHTLPVDFGSRASHPTFFEQRGVAGEMGRPKPRAYGPPTPRAHGQP